MKVNFVTVCSRPQNLAQIHQSIIDGRPDDLNVRWFIVVDTRQVDIKDERIPKGQGIFVMKANQPIGNGAGGPRNQAFDVIEDGYIHVIDDDNILHPNFYPIISQVGLKFNEHVIVGHQIMKDGQIRLLASAENMTVSRVDSASIAWHKNLMGNIRWLSNSYECDGHFVEEMSRTHPDKFVFVPVPISYYNYLR